MAEVITGETVKIVHACDCDLEAEMYPNDGYCDCGTRWPALAEALHALIPQGAKRDLAYLGVALEMPAEDIRAAVAKAIMRSEPLGLALETAASGLLGMSYVVSAWRPAGMTALYHATMLIRERVKPLTVGEAATRLGVEPEKLAAEIEGPYLMILGDGPLAERIIEPEGY